MEEGNSTEQERRECIRVCFDMFVCRGRCVWDEKKTTGWIEYHRKPPKKVARSM
jgi:hypothetical protein